MEKEILDKILYLIEEIKNDEPAEALYELYLEIHGILKICLVPAQLRNNALYFNGRLRNDHVMLYTDRVILIKNGLKNQNYDLVADCFISIFSEKEFMNTDFLFKVLRLFEDAILEDL